MILSQNSRGCNVPATLHVIRKRILYKKMRLRPGLRIFGRLAVDMDIHAYIHEYIHVWISDLGHAVEISMHM